MVSARYDYLYSGRGFLTACILSLLVVVASVAHAAPLTLIQTGGSFDPGNLSTEPGATAFAQDVIFGGSLPIHQIPHLNDGIYGNSNSWIGSVDGSFAGVAFSTTVLPSLVGQRNVNRIAFGRDNTGAFTDRSNGTYIVQFTTVSSPNALTPGSAWTTIDTVAVSGSAVRKLYEFDPVLATGIRLITNLEAPGGVIGIDELEIYAVVPEPSSVLLMGIAGIALGISMFRRRLK